MVINHLVYAVWRHLEDAGLMPCTTTPSLPERFGTPWALKWVDLSGLLPPSDGITHYRTWTVTISLEHVGVIKKGVSYEVDLRDPECFNHLVQLIRDYEADFEHAPSTKISWWDARPRNLNRVRQWQQEMTNSLCHK